MLDGRDVTKVPLRALRHRVVVLPQEAILFSGTLRENLDPLGMHTDEEIWESLKAVGLYDYISAQPAGLGDVPKDRSKTYVYICYTTYGVPPRLY